jgi:hypothetical protein
MGMASVTEIAIGVPEYNGIMPKEKAVIGNMLRHAQIYDRIFRYVYTKMGRWRDIE